MVNKYLFFISAIVFGISLPPFNTYLLPFIIFIPMFFLFDREENNFNIVKFLFLFGFISSLFSVHWIFENRGASLVIRILSGFSLFILVGMQYSLFGYLVTIVKKILPKSFLYSVPILWLVTEQLISYRELSFPWVVPSMSVVNFNLFIQISDIIGASGISLLLLLFNLILYLIIKNYFNRSYKKLSMYIVILFTLLFPILIYGKLRVDSIDSIYLKKESLNAGLVHLSLGAEEKWEKSNKGRIFDRHIFITDSLKKFNPDVIVWGETNYPSYLLNNIGDLRKIREIAKNGNLSIITGSLGYKFIDDKVKKYNSAISISRERIDQYNKVMLVPFGEFFPFSDIFTFLKNISLGQSNFNRGEDLTPFKVDSKNISVNICYEAIFPTFISKQCRESGAIINISNDAWYENSREIDQHNSFNVFRSIENRKPILRLANRGFTGIFTPTGSFIKSIDFDDNCGKIVSVGLMNETTIFNRISYYINFLGNLFGTLLILYGLVLVLINRYKKRRIYYIN